MALLSQAELERLLNRTTDKARRQLLQAFLRIRQQLPLSQLERAIVARNLDEAMRLVGLEPVLNALAETRVLTDQVREAGWFEGLRGLPQSILRQPLVELSLGGEAEANPDTLQRLQQASLARVRAVTEMTRQAIRDTLVRGMQGNAAGAIHPLTLARQLRQIIGLTPRQVDRVERFRARLTAEERPADQVDRMTERFARRQLTTRAETIALTETFTVLHEGKRAQWDRLQREGVIQGQDWEQVWRTSADEAVCPICQPLDGQAAPVGQPFPGGDPPRHPRCRCLVQIQLEGFRKGESVGPRRREILRRLGRVA